MKTAIKRTENSTYAISGEINFPKRHTKHLVLLDLLVYSISFPLK